MDHFFVNPRGEIVLPTVRLVGLDHWVEFNRGGQSIPIEAADYRDGEKRSLATGPTGVLLEMDPGLEPNWHGMELHWEAWTPVQMQDYREGMLDLNRSVMPEPMEGGMKYRLPTRWSVAMKSLLVDLDTCCLSIQTDTPYGRGTPRPEGVDHTIFVYEYLSAHDAEVSAATARRSALSSIGFLTWWVHSVENWKSGLRPTVVDAIEELPIYNRRRRGVLINLARDWKSVNIAHLIKHDVPVFYPWTIVEIVDPRFHLYSPAMYDAYRDYLMTTGSTSGWLAAQIPGFLERFWGLTTYDYLGRKRNPTPRVRAPPIPEGTQHLSMITDFPNWGRRPLANAFQVSLYFNRYHYAILEEDGQTIVLFFRFRPLRSHEIDFAEASIDEDNVTSLRETFKAKYAPRPGLTYSLETGALVVDGPTPSLVQLSDRALEKAVVDSHLGYTDPDSAESQDDVVMDESPETHEPTPEPLSEKRRKKKKSRAQRRAARGLGQDSSTSSGDLEIGSPVPSSWVNAMAMPRLTTTRKLADRLHPGPLRSTIKVTVPPPPSRDREIGKIEFIRNLKEWGRKLTTPGSTFSVPTFFKWNAVFLEHGYLYVEASSEFRMRYWANCWESVTDVQKVLVTAIEHGLPFKICTDPKDNSFFLPANVDTRDFNADVYYETGAPSRALSIKLSSDDLYRQYKVNLLDILRRPHARALIGMGGTYSWIARKFGGLHLVQEFMQGPSIQVTLHQQGWVDKASFLFFRCDKMSPEELKAVVGYTIGGTGSRSTDRTLWPDNATLLASCRHYSGEWNLDCERIFNNLFEQMEAGAAESRTPGDWHQFFRSDNRGEYAPSQEIPKDALSDALTHLQVGFKETWHRGALADLAIPEVWDPIET